MKTCNLSLATVVLGALAVSYSACSAQGQDNSVPWPSTAPTEQAGSLSNAAGSSGAVGVPPAGGSGAPGRAGAPATFGGAPNTGVGGAFTSAGRGGRAGGPGTAGGPATGGAGAPAIGGACKPAAGLVTDVLIDDLEDGDNVLTATGSRVGYWYTYNDGTLGAKQVPDPATLFTATAPGYTASPKFAAVTSGPAFATYGAGMGFDFNNNGKSCPYDASAYKGIKFYAKANTGNMVGMTLTAMIKIPATTPTTADGGTCAAMCEDHYALKPAPALTMAWQQFTITFATMATTTFGQNGFGKVVPFDKSKILAMQFQVAKSVAFNFSVDNITFF